MLKSPMTFRTRSASFNSIDISSVTKREASFCDSCTSLLRSKSFSSIGCFRQNTSMLRVSEAPLSTALNISSKWWVDKSCCWLVIICNWALPIITCNILLKSWATPPASCPTASIFCACRSCSSRLRFSVISSFMAR